MVVTEEEIQDALQTVAAQVDENEPLTIDKYRFHRSEEMPSDKTIYSRYDSWEDALEQHGVRTGPASD